MTTARELRVRAVGRRAVVLAIAAALAVLAVAALRARPTRALVLGAEHKNPHRDVGVLVVPEPRDAVIFVDDVRVGVSPDPIELECGTRRVRIGETGRTRPIDVPCEGRVEL
jgi:hypothetical protein